MMPGQKTEAEMLRLGLVAGVATVADAVRWADAIIQADPRPDHAVIEVSLSGRLSPVDVAGLLAGILGEADPIAARRGLLRRMLAELERQPGRGEEIARALYRLSLAGELPEEHIGTDPLLLDDAFELATVGVYGTLAEALEQLRTYLLEYSAESSS